MRIFDHFKAYEICENSSFSQKFFDKIMFLASVNAPENVDSSSAESKQQYINDQIMAFKNKMKGPGGMSKKDWAFWNTQPVPKFDEVIFLIKKN